MPSQEIMYDPDRHATVGDRSFVSKNAKAEFDKASKEAGKINEEKREKQSGAGLIKKIFGQKDKFVDITIS